ncbi:DUF4232 domain-containing protein [Nocardioides dongxiaopingii]|uniref:DUF4232 domain-containing protein n=1 Tax=Nocardioides sp. S-1144 TaxID=2582905 RepID=UPI001651C978|nr:DUF4232 domain-containing protein [Nocardioides sp. S-1144]
MNKLSLTLVAAVLAVGATTSVVPAGVARAEVSHAAQAARCTDADLTASYQARGAGAGHRYGVVRLTNTSDEACRTGGYGGLSYVGGGDGTQVGAAADRDPGRTRSFVLEPGGSAVSRVDAVVAQNFPRRECRPTAVDGFRVYVPNATRSQFVAHRTTGCASDAVHLLGHRPFRRA